MNLPSLSRAHYGCPRRVKSQIFVAHLGIVADFALVWDLLPTGMEISPAALCPALSPLQGGWSQLDARCCEHPWSCLDGNLATRCQLEKALAAQTSSPGKPPPPRWQGRRDMQRRRLEGGILPPKRKGIYCCSHCSLAGSFTSLLSA